MQDFYGVLNPTHGQEWGLGRFVLGAGIILGDLKGGNLQIFDLHRLASLNLDHFL